MRIETVSYWHNRLFAPKLFQQGERCKLIGEGRGGVGGQVVQCGRWALSSAPLRRKRPNIPQKSGSDSRGCFPRKTNCLATHHPVFREGWGLSKISPPTRLDLEFQGRRDSHWLNHKPPVDISVHKCHELPSPNVPIFISQNIKLAIDWSNIWYQGTVLFAFLIWIKSSCVCVHVCSRKLQTYHLSLFHFKCDRRLCPQMSGWAISVS